jgi:hypothetical protein
MRGLRGGVTAVLAVVVTVSMTAVAAAPVGAASSGGGGTAKVLLPAPGPVATVAHLTGGKGIDLVSGAVLGKLPSTWTEAEYKVSGTATAYTADGSLPADGRFVLTPSGTAPYATRIVVRRPPADRFNGTVVVEWLNVSGGLDAAPEYSYIANELIRAGDAWVGVSAQSIGIEGGPVAVSTPVSALGGAGRGIVALDPARYGKLHHPGDAYSYDIFTQVGRALRDSGTSGPLGGLEPKQLLAAGESQSAIMLTTYIDGVQPLEHMYDGFLVHSRSGSPAPLGTPGQPIDITQGLGGTPTIIRTDTDAPVIMVETESDVVGLLGYLPASQPDTPKIRTWEVAGTSHVDTYQLGSVATAFGCTLPVNSGPDHYIVASALAHLATWSAGGAPPTEAARFDIVGGQYVRNSDGIIEGGIRTPQVDVPVDVLSSKTDPGGSIACLLAGSTVPLSPARLAQLYPSKQVYLSEYTKATDAAIAAGFVLPQDRAEMLSEAQPGRIPG